MHCAHDGHADLHPPCYRNNNDSGIVDICIKTFTGKSAGRHGQPDWLKAQQIAALKRWSQSQSQSHLDPNIWKEGLDLQFVFHFLADYYFCTPGRELSRFVTAQWTNYNPASASACQTKWSTTTTDNKHIIRIQRPNPSQPFTAQSARTIINTLLHEMAHAFLIRFACSCNSCSCEVTRCGTLGLTGHGPLWVRLCEAIEEEAERSFKALLPGRLDLGCGEQGVFVQRERKRVGTFAKEPLVDVEMKRRAG